MLNKINIEYGENISITKDNDWLNFLNSTFNNDQEKIRYLQKAMGYTFSGSAEENKMFLMHRDLSGRNTFIWSIIEAFEDYCNFYDSYNFVKKLSPQWQKYGIEHYFNKRLIYVQSISEDNGLRDKTILRLINEKTITVKTNGKLKLFNSRMKYWIKDYSSGVFDLGCLKKVNPYIIKKYIVIINFPNMFVDEYWTKKEKDKYKVRDTTNLTEKLKQKHNQEAIIRWVIDGYNLYKSEGLELPKSMEEENDEMIDVYFDFEYYDVF